MTWPQSTTAPTRRGWTGSGRGSSSSSGKLDSFNKRRTHLLSKADSVVTSAFILSRAYNVPDKYLKEIEKKCHQAAKTRFSAAYFGKK